MTTLSWRSRMLSKRAEDTFKGLEGEKTALNAALARVFRELVEVDEGGVATRRRAPLKQINGGAAAESLVKALTDARLLATGRDEDNEPTVEVAHESIFTNWERLREWIEVRRDDLRLLRQVRLAAADWDRQGRAKHFLWPHERLLPVDQMVDRMRPTLNPLEREFIRPESERLLEDLNGIDTTHQQRA